VKRTALFATLAFLGLAAGCTVGPRYSRPPAPVPAPDGWKTQPPWEPAQPKDQIAKGEWWKVFNDTRLNDYEEQLLKANQSLIASRDSLEQARSLARVATSGLFPQLSADPSVVRERGSGNRPLNGEVPVIINGVTQAVPPYTPFLSTSTTKSTFSGECGAVSKPPMPRSNPPPPIFRMRSWC
jgi:multidrug efflux system outer membrane protein